MKTNAISEIHSVSRVTLGLLFIYHGLVPKILWLSDTEKILVAAAGFHPSLAEVLSPIAGVAEIILGTTIILFRSSLIPVYLAASALVVLLLFVALLQPELLIQAFNPVSTNLMGLVICFFILKTTPGRNLSSVN